VTVFKYFDAENVLWSEGLQFVVYVTSNK